MEILTIKELLETGVHFGHRVRKWNPKMKEFIFTERKGIHIIDLEKTIRLFEEAYFFVRDEVVKGRDILFVGTKRQVQDTIAEEAKRANAHYVNRRWLGGTLTNYGIIQKRIQRMKDLEDMEKSGAFDALPTKEAMNLRRELMKLLRNLDGLRNMNTLPGLIFVVDTLIEKNAIHEARLLGIPVVAIVDTNCDPDDIDYPIPGNDDAIKATKLITARIADAVMEGREGRSGGRSGAVQAQPAAATMAPSANGGETKDESDRNGKAKA
ncbi:30S ribosomal protein S2 [Candidatus Acetothermia bacterium]|nr:30S ribosomal protein S2 [Candidatus Acetothermia bacterium]